MFELNTNFLISSGLFIILVSSYKTNNSGLAASGRKFILSPQGSF